MEEAVWDGLENLLGGYQTLITTLTQVIYTFLNGILFACIYLRCKNIWAVIVLHAVDDWLCLIPGIYHTVTISTVTMDTSMTSMLITSIMPFRYYNKSVNNKRRCYMESDISDIINDTIIKKRRKLLWVTTKMMRFLRNFTEKSTY